MSDVAIRFDGVSKELGFFASPLHRLLHAFSFGRDRHVPLPVLRDLTFDIPRGQSVAILGPNGVGKSTLLHLIAGLLQPTSGTVTVNGSVRGLLDIGGTFLPDLTGRENARFSHEVIWSGNGDWPDREREIETFADIGDFFDRPVRTYSTGMFLRLAFASATAVAPEILLIDEVLAVGDAHFQMKCYRRIRDLRDRGTTVLIVTHQVAGLPAFCDRVLVLDHGSLIFDGDPATGVDRYYQLFFMAPDHHVHERTAEEHRYGMGGAKIVNAYASRDGIDRENLFSAGERARIVMEVQFERAVAAPQFGFNCSTREGISVYATTSGMLGASGALAAANEIRRVEIAFDLDIAVHNLFIDLSVFEVIDGAVSVLDARLGVIHLVVTAITRFTGITDLGATITEPLP